jgi:hypothetical protein
MFSTSRRQLLVQLSGGLAKRFIEAVKSAQARTNMQ